jgi:hypothetical protein
LTKFMGGSRARLNSTKARPSKLSLKLSNSNLNTESQFSNNPKRSTKECLERRIFELSLSNSKKRYAFT